MEKTMSNKKVILITITVLVSLLILNYLFFLFKISTAENQQKKESEKIISILSSKNYDVENLSYVVVNITNENDIKDNKDFFNNVQMGDKVYYFENEVEKFFLTVLYRPETKDILKIKKE